MTTFAQIAIAIDSRKAEEGAQSVSAGTEKIVEGAREAAKAVNEADRALVDFGRSAENAARRATSAGGGLGLNPSASRLSTPSWMTEESAVARRAALDARIDRMVERVDAKLAPAFRRAEVASNRADASVARLGQSVLTTGSAVDKVGGPFQRFDGMLGQIIKKSPFILGADVVARMAGFPSLLGAVNEGMDAVADGAATLGKRMIGITAAMEEQRDIAKDLIKQHDELRKLELSSAGFVPIPAIGGDGGIFLRELQDNLEARKAVLDASKKMNEVPLTEFKTSPRGFAANVERDAFDVQKDKIAIFERLVGTIDGLRLKYQHLGLEEQIIAENAKANTAAEAAWQDRLARGEKIYRDIGGAAKDAGNAVGKFILAAYGEEVQGFADRLMDTAQRQKDAQAEASALASANQVGKSAYDRARQFDEERAALLRVTLAREAYNRELAKSVYGAASRLVGTYLTNPTLAGIDQGKGAQESLRGTLDDLKFESSLIGMTDDARERAIVHREAEARAAGFQSKAIKDLIADVDAEFAQLQEKRRWDALANNIGDAFGRGLEDGLMDLRNFRDAVESMVLDIERLLIRDQITNPFSQWLSGALSGWLNGPGSSSGGGSPSFDVGADSGAGGLAATYGGPGPGVAMAGGRAVVIHQTIQVTTGGGGWTPRDGDGLRRSARQAAEDANAILQRRR